MWLVAEGFVDKVRSWWSSYMFTGNPSFILACKLKTLKQDLKKWNLEVFGSIDNQKNTLMEELQDFEARELTGDLSEEALARKMVVVIELEKVLLMEEISWRQKSRALWLKEGDKCTKFLHKVANSHRRSNTIETLHTGTQVLSSFDELENHIVQHFENLLLEPVRLRPKLDGLSFESIDSQSANGLEREFEEHEVFKVIRSMAKDKAPGGGSSMGFFQVCWDVVKGDIMRVFAEFHSFHKFEKSLNATFITLIPKKHGTKVVEDFRPISLVSGVYKIISKVLANRLSSVMEHIISKP
ncbi:hypothetical protein I3843_13G156700 [Carya illinoinensis]|nr:hypothetical protein I3843_13G156700 [Carya illinoinensis]